MYSWYQHNSRCNTLWQKEVLYIDYSVKWNITSKPHTATNCWHLLIQKLDNIMSTCAIYCNAFQSYGKRMMFHLLWSNQQTKQESGAQATFRQDLVLWWKQVIPFIWMQILFWPWQSTPRDIQYESSNRTEWNDCTLPLRNYWQFTHFCLHSHSFEQTMINKLFAAWQCLIVFCLRPRSMAQVVEWIV